jgi:AcrR family transcriptional regulator
MTADTIHRADDRERILDATWIVLHRTGYENLKIHMVARVAAVSVGQLYRCYPSKGALLSAVYRQECERSAKVLEDLTSTGDPVDRVRAWVVAMVGQGFGHNRARARWFGTLPDEVTALAGREPGDETDLSSSLSRAIQDGIDSGVFLGADARWDAHLVLMMCAKLSSSDPTWSGSDPEEATARLLRFVLGALRRGDAMAEL